MAIRIGCDVGGTFTDFAIQHDDGRVSSGKVLTTPDDPADAILTWLRAYGETHPEITTGLTDVIHGSTLAINALLQRSGARTVLVTTKGFRDVLLIRRGRRPDMYDVHNDAAAPLIRRSHTVELDERLLPDGTVFRSADTGAIQDTLAEIIRIDAEAVAVSLLHSYVDARHEKAFARALEEVAPNIAVSLSSEVAPEIKEYERASTTSIDAYVKPVVSSYVKALAAGLRDISPATVLDLVLSSGSRVAASTGTRFPSRLIESGPAAGVVAAVDLARRRQLNRIFAFDMGGTSAKGCIATNDHVPITRSYEVDHSVRFKAGSGLPVNVPTVDLIEIGCGGGSIARVSGVGLLAVGPQSAGSKPGPACYGLGGEEPTVTDANVVLGYLDPHHFLGGEMVLDRTAAEKAVERLGQSIGLGVDETAWGIYRIANESMANAMKTYAAERGVSLDHVPIAAYGGAGPVHAADFARRLHATQVLLPPNAGVASAVGMLLAGRSFETVRTFKRHFGDVDGTSVQVALKTLTGEAAAAIHMASDDPALRVQYFAEVCYAGQGSALMVEIPHVDVAREIIPALQEKFSDAYVERYGKADRRLEPEFVTLRAVVIDSRSDAATLSNIAASSAPASAASTHRQAYDPATGTYVKFAVMNRADLQSGVVIDGPALIEERETTTVVPSDWSVTVDADATLILTAATRKAP